MADNRNSIMGYIIAGLLFVSLVINAYLISHINVLNTYIYKPYNKFYEMSSKFLNYMLKGLDKRLQKVLI